MEEYHILEAIGTHPTSEMQRKDTINIETYKSLAKKMKPIFHSALIKSKEASIWHSIIVSIKYLEFAKTYT